MTYEQEMYISRLSASDPIYQDLLSACQKAESEFLRIRSTLCEEDRNSLDRYISLCEELEYRRTCLILAQR